MHLILHELKWSLLKFTVPKNTITIKTNLHLPPEYVTLVDFGILFRSFEFSCSQILKTNVALNFFYVERTWWMLFQKRVVRTKLDIYFS
jgi:hypothetical protein